MPWVETLSVVRVVIEIVANGQKLSRKVLICRVTKSRVHQHPLSRITQENCYKHTWDRGQTKRPLGEGSREAQLYPDMDTVGARAVEGEFHITEGSDNVTVGTIIVLDDLSLGAEV